MDKITFVPNTEKMEYQRAEYLQSNLKFANIFITTTTLLSFKFPTFLQTATFKIQRGVINDATQSITWTDHETLNNTYKKTGFFKSYNFTTALSLNYVYRIIVGSYISYQILQPIYVSNLQSIDENYSKNYDENKDYIVDDNGDYMAELK